MNQSVERITTFNGKGKVRIESGRDKRVYPKCKNVNIFMHYINTTKTINEIVIRHINKLRFILSLGATLSYDLVLSLPQLLSYERNQNKVDK